MFDYVAIECCDRFTKALSQKTARFVSKFVLTIKASSTWLYFRTLRPVFANHNGYVINFYISMIMTSSCIHILVIYIRERENIVKPTTHPAVRVTLSFT